MACEVIRRDLAAFHFGDVDDAERGAIEQHVLGCGECLRAYLALKRSFEAPELRPSGAAQQRLRAAVAGELESRAVRAPWSWWERPLAVALAALALVVAAAAVGATETSPQLFVATDVGSP